MIDHVFDNPKLRICTVLISKGNDQLFTYILASVTLTQSEVDEQIIMGRKSYFGEEADYIVEFKGGVEGMQNWIAAFNTGTPIEELFKTVTWIKQGYSEQNPNS